jgi:hypothetical protein
MAITGHACDGWVFWSVQTEENAPAPNGENLEPTQQNTGAVLVEEASQSAEPVVPAPVATKTDPKKTGVFLVPNQKGVPEGQIRWHCRDCGKSFIASAVNVPGVCPNHQAS